MGIEIEYPLAYAIYSTWGVVYFVTPSPITVSDCEYRDLLLYKKPRVNYGLQNEMYG